MPAWRNASLGLWASVAILAAIAFIADPLLGQELRKLPTRSSAPAAIKPLGRLPGAQRLNLAITLPLRNQEQLQTLLHDLYDPTSPNYRHFLTVEQFTEQFGPTPDDYERVASYARANGLAVTHSAPNRLVLDVTGVVADVERTFHLKMQVYQHPTEARTFYAPDVEPSVDASLPVQGVSGLSTFAPPRPANLHPLVSGASTIGSEAGSGPGGVLLGSDIRAAYAPGVTLDGTGQAVGVFEEGSYNLSDIQLYFTTVNQPLNVPIVNVLLDAVTGSCGKGCDDTEDALDIEAAISMAPKLSALLVYEGSYPVDILNQMATDNIAKQLSASYVWYPEPTLDDPIFEEFAAQGQSFFASSGDGGAFSLPSCASNCWTARFPADDVHVSAVGGTELTTTGPGGTWKSETSWPLSGGGVTSDGFAIPTYQLPLINSANHGSNTLRNVPDVAAQAAGMYTCAKGSCFVVGGTSLSSPLWAGFLALSNQQADGAPIGFLNPAIYALAQGNNYGSDFHDITTGNNFNSYSPTLFSAVSGYDLVTGLGTPNGQSLISALAPVQAVPNFALVSTPGSLSVVQGSQETSTISLQAVNGFTGTVNLRATVLGQPAGVTASLSQASILGAGASTLTVSTTNSTFDPNIVIVVTGTSGALTQTVYISLAVLIPDLVETALASTLPALVSVNESFSVTDTTQNIGQATAGSSVTRYYFSATPAKTSSSVLLTGSRSVPSLAVNATSSGTVNVTVPSDVWPNTKYYLLACADDTGTVPQIGNGNCVASSGTTELNTPAQLPTSTTLAVTSGGNPVTSVSLGGEVTLTATVVSGGVSVNTGQVNFCDASAMYCTDIHLLGTAQLASNGTAMLRFVPSIGSHSYKAMFVGTVSETAIDTTSTSAIVKLTVTGTYPTTTSIAQSGNMGGYTLSAAVTGLGGSFVPSGMVSFLDTSSGNAVLGTAALSAGTPEMNWLSSQTAVTQPNAIAVGDFNGDGKSDLAITPLGCNTFIFLGNGDGTFTAAPNLATNCFSFAIAIGDFNGDGKADVAVGTDSTTSTTVGVGSIKIFLGNGDGTFSPAPVSPAAGFAPESMVVGDFNGDGKADLAIANLSSNTVTVLLGNGDGTFASAATLATDDEPQSLVGADFNGDGKVDLAIGYRSSSPVSILLGNGDGTFTPGTSVNIGGPPCSLVTADFNGDGKSDLAAANCGENNVAVLLGNGDGTFKATAASPATGSYPISITVGDFNGDGKADLAIANLSSNNTTVLLGNGDGTFTPAANNPAAGSEPYFVATGNFNGGSTTDLVLANLGSYTVTVNMPEMVATATVTGISPVGTGTHEVDASYPGDSNYSSSVSGTTGLTAVTKSTPTVTVTPGSSSITTTQTLSVTVAVSGTPTPTGSVTLSSGSYTSAATTLTSGSAQINVPAGSLAAGSDTLKASYTPDSSSSSTYNTATGTSSAVTVTQATQTIAFSNPGTQTVGTPLTLSATATSGLAVSFTSTTTSICTVSGPTVTFIASGTCTIDADQAGNSIYAAATMVPQSFTVNPGPTFTIGGGSSSISVAPGAVTGNTVTITVTPSNGFTGTVNLTCSISPAAASDPATCSLSPSSVTITGAGAQTATLTIFTTAATTAENQLKRLLWPSAGTALALLLFGLPRRRRNWPAMLGVLALFVAFAAIGCGGGGGSNGGGGGGGNPGTTPGTYSVTVTGTSGSMTGTAGTITLTVQ